MPHCQRALGVFPYILLLSFCIPLISSGLKDLFLDLLGSLLLILIMCDSLADVVVKYLKNLDFLLDFSCCEYLVYFVFYVIVV